MDSSQMIVIDSDAGVDDAMAILVAMAHRRVIAMCSVFGNTSRDQATANLQRIAALHAYEPGTSVESQTTVVPEIYAGSSQPLLSLTTPPTWPGHGSNGTL